jgi:hypothetical protein
MKKGICAFIFLLAITWNLHGQATLGMDTAMLSYSYSNPVMFNSTDMFHVTIKNYGSTSYTGQINVAFSVDTTGGSGPPTDSLGSHVITSTIAPGAGVLDSMQITINSSGAGAFRSGINTVVIWPRSQNSSFITHDSLRLSLLVNPSAIESRTVTIKPSLFPNPARERVYILDNDSSFSIEQVRILDASGRIVYAGKCKSYIDLETIGRGFYTLEFVTTNGKTCRVKLVKE